MLQHAPTTVNVRPSHRYRWTVGILCLLGLIGLSSLDFLTGKEISMGLFYLVLVSIVTWFVGSRIGLAFCAWSAVMSLLIKLPIDPASLPPQLWNAGLRFGVFSAFCILLDHAHTPKPESIIKTLCKAFAVTATFAFVLAGIGLFAQRKLLAHPAVARNDLSPTTQLDDSQPLSKLALELDTTLQSSRPVLLGSRDPNGPSCVSAVMTGQVQETLPTNPADLDGGPGTKLATLYFFDRANCKSPESDYQWHQTRLKTFLQNEAVENAKAQEQVDRLAQKVAAFCDTVNNWTAIPTDVHAIHFYSRDDWPSFCLSHLDAAIGANDLDAAKRWATELNAAMFSLQDLHHWTGFLVENHLAALDFQAKCETLFTAADALKKPYDPNSNISQFPAGVLSLNGIGNYYEVEHQAERLYSTPSDQFDNAPQTAHATPGSTWIMPNLRDCFLKMENALGPANKQAWELAAHTPYEHSYLVNMLFRAVQADSTDELTTALKRFDANNPKATITELMGELMYRGHSFGGLEWADRFQPLLMSAADELHGNDRDAFMAACLWTNKFYHTPTNYGVTFTLRDALEEKRLDCVRATDMIGAIFRNSGRPRFGHVRWCTETSGHSVAAYLTSENNKPLTLLADGMNPPPQPEIWPDAYFHGHEWPAELSGNPTPYCAELYIRGIDSYIWAEGYIVRGPNAGNLQKAAVPYLRLRTANSYEKVFDGPYPQ